MKKYFAIGLLMLLTSCAATDLNIDNTATPPPTFDPILPNQIIVKDVHWQVINNIQLQTLAKQNNPDLVLYALNPDDFKSVLFLIQDTDRYIEENNSLIFYYRGTNASATPTGTTPTPGQ